MVDEELERIIATSCQHTLIGPKYGTFDLLNGKCTEAQYAQSRNEYEIKREELWYKLQMRRLELGIIDKAEFEETVK